MNNNDRVKEKSAKARSVSNRAERDGGDHVIVIAALSRGTLTRTTHPRSHDLGGGESEEAHTISSVKADHVTECICKMDVESLFNDE